MIAKCLLQVYQNKCMRRQSLIQLWSYLTTDCNSDHHKDAFICTKLTNDNYTWSIRLDEAASHLPYSVFHSLHFSDLDINSFLYQMQPRTPEK